MGNAATGLLDVDFEEDDGASSTSSSLSCEDSLMDFEDFIGCARETVIILDWDDTLMCSSELRRSRKESREPDPAQMQVLAQAVESVLRMAMRLGRTAIVTNANLCWVRTTASLFMPSVVPLLDEVAEVVSARQSYAKRWPGNRTAWKRQAFRDICSRGRVCEEGRVSQKAPLNLVVLGDSAAEIRAGPAALKARGHSDSIVKTVKFQELPTASELAGELKAVLRSLEHLVAEDKSVSKQLVRGGGSRWAVRDVSCQIQIPFLDALL